MRRGGATPRQGCTKASRYLRAAEVAAILHVSPKTESRCAKEGKLPFLKTLGGHRRYSIGCATSSGSRRDEAVTYRHFPASGG